jgi:hypothetical protein
VHGKKFDVGVADAGLPWQRSSLDRIAVMLEQRWGPTTDGMQERTWAFKHFKSKMESKSNRNLYGGFSGELPTTQALQYGQTHQEFCVQISCRG